MFPGAAAGCGVRLASPALSQKPSARGSASRKILVRWSPGKPEAYRTSGGKAVTIPTLCCPPAPAVCSCRSRPEAEAILKRVHEAVDHAAEVTRRVQHLDPICVECVRIASQVAKVLHHHKRLVVV